ncbi:MAG: YqgE/AlgH family protein [Verrucomicrobia bacterium]|nr:YqgE/AlgH family protein [Verrucomicrobiota bacterium]
MADPQQALQGKLILDSGKLAGSYFEKTVILICRHDSSGSFGLVLNRPLKRTLGSVISEPLVEGLAKTPIYTGGPVQPEALSFLQETEVRSEYDILPQLTLGHSLEALKERFALSAAEFRLHAYSGYSGWAAGQLADEMKAGCWIVHPASESLVFHPHPDVLWRHILREKGGLHRLLGDCPDNPSLN